MNKQELIGKIAEKTELTKNDAKKCLDATIETIMEAVKEGNDVSLTGFGIFKQGTRVARTGRNPKTGEEIQIAAGKTVKFSVGRVFKNTVAGS